MNNYSIQIKDILEHPLFKDVAMIAGHSGLHKIIKWVHVLEVSNVQKLLKGNELILTTGVSFKNNVEQFRHFMEGIIEANCAGLCIELGTYIQEVPEEIIELANQHQFPIIVFHKEVSFVEITQGLHSIIINQQYLAISKLENYSQLLNKETLHAQNVEQILKIMYKYLKIQIIFEVEGKDPIFYPNMLKKKRDQLLKKKNDPKQKSKIKGLPVYLFENKYAEIFLLSDETEITEFEMLILDRTATALAQLLIRNLYVEEKKGLEDAKWLEEWLEGKHSVEDIDQFVLSLVTNYKQNGSTVFVISLPRNQKNKQLDVTYFKMYCKAVFDKKGFYSFALERKNYLIIIFLNKREFSTMKTRLQEGINNLETSDLISKQERFSVGKFVKNLSHIHESYQSALDTLYIRRKIETPTYFYDDLHLYHLIYKLQKHTDLQNMVDEYLKPLIEFDEKHNSQLLETLEVYLQSNGSKQETANRLFIVRQTLYHRLRKIESLIGTNFMDGENRLALEFMLLARKFMMST